MTLEAGDHVAIRELVRAELRRSDAGVLIRQLQGLVTGGRYEAGATSAASTSTSFIATDPSVVVPFDGRYVVAVQAQTNGPCVVSATGAGFTPSDEDGFYTPVGQTGHGMFEAALEGGQALSLAFRSTDGGSRTLLRPRMLLTPIA